MEVTFNGVSLSRLREYLDRYGETRNECDGVTQLVIYRLSLLGIKYKTYVGRVNYGGEERIPLHYWAVVKDDSGEEWVIDYRLGMWIKVDEPLPYGVFRLAESLGVEYEGERVHIDVSKLIYTILLGG